MKPVRSSAALGTGMCPAALAASFGEKPRPRFHLLGPEARAVVAGSPIARFTPAQLLWPALKEYAELEWPIDLLIAVVWVAYAVVFFGTIAYRRIKHIYVANWFFAAYIITIAVLHIVNNIAIPVSATKSYVVYAGVVDAMVQWMNGSGCI